MQAVAKKKSPKKTSKKPASRKAAPSKKKSASSPSRAAVGNSKKKSGAAPKPAGKSAAKLNPAAKSKVPTQAPVLPQRPAGKAAAQSKRAVAPVAISAPPLPTYSSRLNKTDLAFFRDLLLRKRHELLHDMDTMQAEALSKNRQDAAGDLSSMPIHMADLGSDNYEQEFTLGLIQGERVILREIDEALLRIQNGKYGLCMATGKPIGKSRLKAQPWARFSYEYMLSQEKNRYRRI